MRKSANSSAGGTTRFTLEFSEIALTDVSTVGGKNASLGEMVRELSARGVPVPGGFATTAEAYREHLRSAGLVETISQLLSRARAAGKVELAGPAIRAAILAAEIPATVDEAIRSAYRELCDREGSANLSVAVRSSATAEDLAEASFAGQHQSFLNIEGEDAVVEACRQCFASLFTNRAIVYREGLGFDHLSVALSVGVQRMVRSDLAGAGVLFTLEPETGFPNLVVVSAAWGLGESVVLGSVDPDRYLVFKPTLETARRPILETSLGTKIEKVIYRDGGVGVETVATTAAEREAAVLSSEEVLTLARWGVVIEQHYGKPMDVEWAKDGLTGELFIVQARPETVWSQRQPTVVSYRLTGSGETLVTGMGVGGAIATGRVVVLDDPNAADEFPDGSVLVAPRTDPDWGPYLRRASAVVTDHGGATSHAAIVCRELGIPAVVGAGNATEVLAGHHEVTVSCESDVGRVLAGRVEFDRQEERVDDLEEIDLPVMINVATPAVALRSWQLPARGVGLARLEFLIGEVIGVHPMALLRPDLADPGDRAAIAERTRGYDDPIEFFVEALVRGIAKIAASVWPNPAVVRTSDFKTNEYAGLLGGSAFEHSEDNPMIGFRGASRYVSAAYRPAFELECRALKIVREEMGLDNVIPMIPFCRTLKEADAVLETMAQAGLRRGENGLLIYVMCEIPSNVILARQFAERFDGFSIGSNDLTQLTLGADRDNEALSGVFDESDEAVTTLIAEVIRVAHEAGRPVGFCGQRPTNDAAYAEFLLRAGVDSISVDPGSVVTVTRRLAEAARK